MPSGEEAVGFREIGRRKRVRQRAVAGWSGKHTESEEGRRDWEDIASRGETMGITGEAQRHQ